MRKGQDFNPDHAEAGRISIRIKPDFNPDHGETGPDFNPDHGEGGRMSTQIMRKDNYVECSPPDCHIHPRITTSPRIIECLEYSYFAPHSAWKFPARPEPYIIRNVLDSPPGICKQVMCVSSGDQLPSVSHENCRPWIIFCSARESA